MRCCTRRAFLLVLPFALLLMTTACTDPADPVALGQLCQPAADACPTSVALHRPTPGRNSLEFTLTNLGADSTVQLLATTTQELDFRPPRDRSEDGSTILVKRDFPLGEGEILRDTFTSRELTIVRDFTLELSCLEGECNHRLEYLFFSESVECFDDGVCGRGEFCEQTAGRCVECVQDSQCSVQQSCDVQTGQCFPGGSAGCSTLTGEPPLHLFFGLLVLTVFAFRRRESGRAVVLTTTALMALLVLTPAVSKGSTGASASISAGGGPRILTGELGPLTRTGWGVAVQKQIRLRRVGASFQLASHSFALRDENLPNELRLSGYSITLGPRAYFTLPSEISLLGPEHSLEMVVSFEYTRWGVAENRLAHLTGLDLSFHALGPTLGVGWKWSGIQFIGQTNYSQIFDWPGGVFSVDLMIGLGI